MLIHMSVEILPVIHSLMPLNVARITAARFLISAGRPTHPTVEQNRVIHTNVTHINADGVLAGIHVMKRFQLNVIQDFLNVQILVPMISVRIPVIIICL